MRTEAKRNEVTCSPIKKTGTTNLQQRHTSRRQWPQAWERRTKKDGKKLKNKIKQTHQKTKPKKEGKGKGGEKRRKKKEEEAEERMSERKGKKGARPLERQGSLVITFFNDAVSSERLATSANHVHVPPEDASFISWGKSRGSSGTIIIFCC